ncbi:hypothetical protein [Salinigranum halophilum]|uniref:hypothetical protein n=1 Tax=Salinigranum halophilum TaxID=2565931 RepID=UPI0010A7A766|nr:hypothetical protein [Salinigranum halophilum]
MTDRSSAPENVPSGATLGTNVHRVEAVNDHALDRCSSTDHGDRAARARRAFDFELTRSAETTTATATVLELFTGYLAAASHELCESVAGRVDVTRIVVDGTVPTDADGGPAYQPPVTAVSVTLCVETDADDAALERWRRTLRDAEATQEAIRTDTTVSLAVVRESR